jgi:hypothetical protein
MLLLGHSGTVAFLSCTCGVASPQVGIACDLLCSYAGILHGHCRALPPPPHHHNTTPPPHHHHTTTPPQHHHNTSQLTGPLVRLLERATDLTEGGHHGMCRVAQKKHTPTALDAVPERDVLYRGGQASAGLIETSG